MSMQIDADKVAGAARLIESTAMNVNGHERRALTFAMALQSTKNFDVTFFTAAAKVTKNGSWHGLRCVKLFTGRKYFLYHRVTPTRAI